MIPLLPRAVFGTPGWLALGLLLSGPCGPSPIAAGGDTTPAALVRQGRDLYEQHGCASCHTPAVAAGTGVVVPLDDLAERYTPSLLAELLSSPPPQMPRFKLTPADREALAAYLLQSKR